MRRPLKLALPVAALLLSAASGPSMAQLSSAEQDQLGKAAEAALKKLFAFSILWLFLIFSLIVVERALGIAAFPSVLG